MKFYGKDGYPYKTSAGALGSDITNASLDLISVGVNKWNSMITSATSTIRKSIRRRKK